MATFYKGNTPIPATPNVGGAAVERTMLGANALINGFEVGQDLGYGIVYKSFGGGSAMVVAKYDYNRDQVANNLYAWVNTSGCGVDALSSNGFENMVTLYNASTGGCNFEVGSDIYDDLYITGSLYSGSSGWYPPSENELQEVYDSEVIKYTHTSGDGGYYFSSTSATDNSKGRMLSFQTGTWADSGNPGADEARIRLVKRI